MVQVNQSEAQGGGNIPELRFLLCASHLNIRDRKRAQAPMPTEASQKINGLNGLAVRE